MSDNNKTYPVCPSCGTIGCEPSPGEFWYQCGSWCGTVRSISWTCQKIQIAKLKETLKESQALSGSLQQSLQKTAKQLELAELTLSRKNCLLSIYKRELQRV